MSWARAIIGRNFTIALAGLLLAPATAGAQGEPFYSGKTVRIIVGFTPGGFYDRWARLLSRYMPKYIPGNPTAPRCPMPSQTASLSCNFILR